MVLNPAWFNALVDDDGSGTTGTVWNKPTIKGLTDNIDAELGRLDAVPTPWNVQVRSSNGGTPTYNAASAYYVKSGSLVWVGFNVSFYKGSLGAGGIVYVSVPFPFFNAPLQFGGLTISYMGTLGVPVAGIASYSNPGVDYVTLLMIPAGGATAPQFLVVEHLGSGLITLEGTGTYCKA